MSDKYIMYDPAEFDKIEIKPAENSDEITRLRAENEKLREALEPFAKFELFVEGSPHFDRMKNETPVITTGDGNCSKWIYRKHLRRARAALEGVKEPPAGENNGK